MRSSLHISFIRFSLTLGICLLTFSPGKASDPFVLKGDIYPLSDPNIKNHIQYLEDSTNRLTLKDIGNKKFLPFEQYHTSTYHPKSTYWFKLTVVCETDKYNLWFLEILNPFVDKVQAWYINGKDTIAYDPSGIQYKFSSKTFKHKNFLFPFKAEKNDTVSIYFTEKNKVKSSVRTGIRPAEQFSEYALNEYYLLGVFYGILFIMGLYNLFIYFSTRDSIYLYYVFYVLCYCLNSLKIDGLGSQFFWPDIPAISPFVDTFSPLLLILSFYIYSRKFLGLTNYAYGIQRYLNLSMLLYIGLFFINYFVVDVGWLNFFYFLPFGIIYISGIVSYQKGNAAAGYFLAAFTILISGFTLFLLRGIHLIPTTIFTIYALNFGFLLEVVLFSYGMGQRLKMEREKQALSDKLLIDQLKENEILKDSINRDLEDKVRERTLEVESKNIALGDALKELKEKNEQIRMFNILLEQDNQNLNQDIKEITKARFMLKDLSLEEFQKIYPDEESCFKYLAEIKWVKPYACKKCDSKDYYQGKTLYARRCSKCHYDESVTSYTIFHNSKMPLTTSFYLTYMVIANKDISSHALSEKLGLRQKTCWAYKKKIVEIMEKKTAGKWNSKDWGKIFYS